jgi:serine/threonine protein kinase
MTDLSGAQIAEYVLEEEVAARSTEVAYRTTHRVLPRSARVAILSPAFVGVRLAEAQLMREACILETLHHSGVPRVFECGVIERRPWIATEYIDGVTIEQASSDRPLSIVDALAVLRDAAAVLAHAHHRGVVHRNLTPAMIVRTPSRGFPICVTGWGDASVNATVFPQVVAAGSRFYRAPELATATAIDADGRADVFALGAIMFEATTLVLPEPVHKFPGMPAAVYALFESMLARRAEDRPTAEAVCVEACRLTEVFADGENAIEEVEVELVDISRSPPPMPSLGWMPAERMASLQGTTIPVRRRREQ